jgi:arginine utilization protein RocB
MSLLLALTGGGGPTSYTLTASTGTYTLTGVSAGILKSKVVSANSGTYAYTGTAASILRSKRVVGASGSYSYTGVSASLLRSRVLVGNSGSYTLSGTSANILKSRLIVGIPGTYTYTGSTANIVYTPSVGVDVKVSWVAFDTAESPLWGPTDSEYLYLKPPYSLDMCTGELILPITPDIIIELC